MRPVAAAPPGGWRWRWLLAAPHRLGFSLALLVLAASALWWAAVMAGALAPPAALPRGLAHGAVMAHGFMPLFFAGFLFTAGPKWLQLPGPSAARLAPALLAQAAGWLLWLAGAHLGAALAACGLALVAAGQAAVTARFALLLRASRAADLLHARLVAVALGIGVLVLAALVPAVLLERWGGARALVLTGLWGCVAAVFLVVAHRMLAVFHAGALSAPRGGGPGVALWLLLAVCGFEAAAPWLALAGPPPDAWTAARLLAAVAGGVLVLHMAWAWARLQPLRTRLLRMLRLGFVWLGAGLLLSAAEQALRAHGGHDPLPLAGLHAVALGWMGSLMVAMVTRVSSAHAGRPNVADAGIWVVFWLVQAAAALRVVAAVPALAAAPRTGAALLWAGAVTAWALRLGDWHGRARADGRPG